MRIREFLNYVMSPIQMPEGRCLMEEIEKMRVGRRREVQGGDRMGNSYETKGGDEAWASATEADRQPGIED